MGRSTNRYKLFPVAMLRAAALSNADGLAVVHSNSESLLLQLKIFFSKPLVSAAMEYMAPEFWSRVQEKINNQTIDADEINTLLNYVSRLAHRATPFGLSATCSVFPVGARIPLRPPTLNSAIKFDVFMDEIVRQRLIGNGVFAEKFLRNNTCVVWGKEIRYIKFRESKTRAFQATLSAAENDDALEFLLAHAVAPRSKDDLCSELVRRYLNQGLSYADAEEYVKNVIEQQLLTNDHLFSLNDDILNPEDLNVEISHSFNEVLTEIREKKIGFLDGRRKIQSMIGEKPSADSANVKNFFHLDSWRDVEHDSGLNPRQLAEINSAIHFIAQASEPKKSNFTKLIELWEDRYGDCDLPLALLVDERNGIFFRASGLDKAIISVLPKRVVGSPSLHTLRGQIRDFLSANNGIADQELRFPQSLIEAAGRRELKHPPPIMASICVLEHIDTKKVVMELRSHAYLETHTLFGRFTRANSELSSALDIASSASEFGDIIHAEVLFNPRSVNGNVCRRASLSDYEISIRSGSNHGAIEIDISDLVVCRFGERLELRSKKLNKWVRTRISTAYNDNLRENIPLYRFFAQLSSQHLNWQDGFGTAETMTNISHTPRIWLGQVLIKRAEWNLSAMLVSELVGAKTQELALARLADLLNTHKVPTLVEFGSADHVLLVDISTRHGQLMLLDHARKKKEQGLRIVEGKIPGYQSAVQGPCGDYSHEILLGYSPLEPLPSPGATSNRVCVSLERGTDSDLRFFPGGEWSYLKISAHPAEQDAILESWWINLIGPGIASGEIGDAHFVRLTDSSGEHLRLRARTTNQRTSAAVLSNFISWAASCDGKLISNGYSCLPYTPEWNRYGGRFGLPVAHEIFTSSSAFCIAMLRLNTELRFQVIIWSMDLFLRAFGLASLSDRLSFCTKQATSFQAEYKVTETERKWVVKAVKDFPSLIEIESRVKSLNLADSVWLERVNDSGLTYSKLDKLNDLVGTLPSVLGSIVHMHLNRCFSIDPRAQECQAWDVLRRIYDRDLHLFERKC